MMITVISVRRCSKLWSLVPLLLILLVENLSGAVADQPAWGMSLVQTKTEGLTNSPPCRADANDYLYLYAINYSAWTNSLGGSFAGHPLILHLGGLPLAGVYPKFFNETISSISTNFVTNTTAISDFVSKTNITTNFVVNTLASFGVQLHQDARNRAAWKMLARNSVLALEKPLEVTIGFEGGPTLHSWVYPLDHAKASPFLLVILSKGRIWLGTTVIIGVFIILCVLARKSDLLRDPNLPWRPDGSKQFSLARAQMAVWFFLVIGAFFFLWLISGDTDTLNASVITLIGISAATAVSSAFIDSSKQRELDENILPAAIRKKCRENILTGLEDEKRQIEEALSKLRATRESMETPPDELASKTHERQELALNQKIRRLDRQIDYYNSSPLKACAHDILGEKGVISFHRFQMCVWTVVLGIIFTKDVYRDLAMPEFSATLLGLMGISSGTFIGFKIPEQPKA